MSRKEFSLEVAARVSWGAVDIEQPLDPSPFGVGSTLPMRRVTAQGVAIFNVSIRAQLAKHPDSSFYHIEPARVLGFRFATTPEVT